MSEPRDNGSANGGEPPNRRPNDRSGLSAALTAAAIAGGAAALIGGAVALAKLSRSDSSTNYIDTLSTEINDFYREHHQTTATYEKKVQLKDALHSLIMQRYPCE